MSTGLPQAHKQTMAVADSCCRRKFQKLNQSELSKTSQTLRRKRGKMTAELG
jgi:hypothetical protein